MKNNNLSIPMAIIVAGIIVAAAVFYGGNNDKLAEVSDANNFPEQQEKGLAPVLETDHVLGSLDAEITIIEYSDMECPFCKKFHQTMNQIMEEYGKEGKVKWVYRHFPLDNLHNKARKEAEATECADELGGIEKFWEYINRLYETTPSNNRFDLAELPNIAEEVGLDRSAFEECLSSGRNADKVEKSFQSGIAAGVDSTPYSFAITRGGQEIPIRGALDYPQLKQAIDQMLGTKTE